MSQLSHRIQLCTSNLASGLSRRLTAAHAINPANHIALYIDGGVYETQDPRATNDLSDASIKGGIHCTPVPILNGEPESIAIERLECVDKHFNTGYSFATYNCGGYTHDILKMAGLGVAAFENFGIGGEFASRNGKDMKESIRRTTEKCNQHIHSLRKAISTLESGKDATLELKTLESVFSSDARLQLIVSAARNKLQSNREWMEKNVTNSSVTSTPYFKDGRSGEMSTFKRGMKKHLEDIVGSIDEDGRVWIKQHYPYLDSEILQKISHQ
ncbi:MAG: hypothetical protein JST16_08575 [Bdellovibrionales bacterium]|nr:hypothetical protein [Bdellovibrionales bacterium]